MTVNISRTLGRAPILTVTGDPRRYCNRCREFVACAMDHNHYNAGPLCAALCLICQKEGT